MFKTKEGMKVGSSWEELGIKFSRSGGKAKCPDCKDKRKSGNERDTPLSFVDENYAKCHNCDAEFLVDRQGYTAIKSDKDYKMPTQLEEYSDVDERVGKWFLEERLISLNTLRKLKITSANGNIEFNFMEQGKRVNVKYRDAKKQFRMHGGSKLIFYNIDALYNTDGDIIITEGEIDCASYIQSDISSVISVPNGASKGSMNLEYLNHHYHLFENESRAKLKLKPLKRVIIATDDDDAGFELRKELIRRIGAERCWIADLQGSNDPNELLKKKGVVGLRNSIDNARPAPFADVKTVYDMREELEKLRTEGLNPGLQIGCESFRDLISFEQPRMTICTGISTHGKSEFVDDMISRLSVDHNWRFGVFSPENFPIEYHISKLVSKITGKQFNDVKGIELDECYEFIAKHFFWIYPEDDNYTLENILRISDLLVARYGINGLIIDPWTEIDKLGKNGTEDINEYLSVMSRYKRNKNVHIFLVAHPTKMGKDEKGQVIMPTLMDISGSGHFYNKTDYGITVYRDFAANDTVKIQVNKVKFKHLGRLGTVTMQYNIKSGRYQDQADIDRNGWDDSNWLHREEQLEIRPTIIESNPIDDIRGGIVPNEDLPDDLPF